MSYLEKLQEALRVLQNELHNPTKKKRMKNYFFFLLPKTIGIAIKAVLNTTINDTDVFRGLIPVTSVALK